MISKRKFVCAFCACLFFAGPSNACVEDIYTASGTRVGFAYCVGAVEQFLKTTGGDTAAFGHDNVKEFAGQIDKICTKYNSSIHGPSVDEDIKVGRAAMTFAFLARDTVEVESLVRTCEGLFDEHLK